MPDVSQQRMTGAFIPSGSRVVVVVSSGPTTFGAGPTVGVPRVTGTSQGNALSALQDLGFNAQVYNDYSETVPRGRVIAQLPAAGVAAAEGSEVALIVSSGGSPVQRADVALPDVVGMREADAVAALQAAALSPQVSYQHHPSVPAGYVSAQVPDASTVEVVEVRRNNLWIWVAAAVAVLGLVLLGVLFFGQRGARVATVPDVTGLTQTEAVSVLQSAGFRMGSVEASESAEVAEGTVVGQDPAAGAEAAEGTAVDLVVSGGPQQVQLPDVTGMTEGEALSELQAQGMSVTVTRSNSVSVERGVVMSQSPRVGSRVPVGSEVAIVVSEGAPNQTANVPDVVGMSEADARAALTAAGFEVFRAENPSDDVAAGQVIAQAPAAGEAISQGGTVAIVVSTGPPQNPDLVEVPNVVGRTLADAQQALTRAGFQPLPVRTDATGAPNTVVAQTPEAGARAQRGSSVVVFYVAQ